MYAYCTSSHMSKQFKKWPIKYHFGWVSCPAKLHIKYCMYTTNTHNNYTSLYIEYMYVVCTYCNIYIYIYIYIQ